MHLFVGTYGDAFFYLTFTFNPNCLPQYLCRCLVCQGTNPRVYGSGFNGYGQLGLGNEDNYKALEPIVAFDGEAVLTRDFGPHLILLCNISVTPFLLVPFLVLSIRW